MEFFHKYQTACPIAYEKLKEKARQLRKYHTEAEEVLWTQIRQKLTGVKFRRQHIIGDYIVDFVCLKEQIVIEVDGKYHDAKEQNERDLIRDADLRFKGFQVLRFSNDAVMIDTDNVIKIIKQTIDAHSSAE